MKYKIGDEFTEKKNSYVIRIIGINGTDYIIELTRKDDYVTTFKATEKTIKQYTRPFTKLDKALK